VFPLEPVLFATMVSQNLVISMALVVAKAVAKVVCNLNWDAWFVSTWKNKEVFLCES
jgi:hypothetical protein